MSSVILKLLVPLLTPSLLFLLLQYFYVGESLGTILHSVLSYKLILPSTWFIVSLIILYVIFYSLSHFFSNERLFLISLGIVVLLTCMAFFIGKLPSTYFQANLAFVGGSVYKVLEKKYGKVIKHKPLILICFLMLIFATVVSKVKIQQGNLFLVFLTTLIWTYSMSYILSSFKYVKNKVVDFFASISYEMYICQGITFIFIHKDFFSSTYLYLLVVIGFNIFFSYMMHRCSRLLIEIIVK